MTHVTCRLTARNRDQLRNPTLGNQLVTFMNHSQSLAMRGQTIFWWHRIDTAVARHHISHGVCWTVQSGWRIEILRGGRLSLAPRNHVLDGNGHWRQVVNKTTICVWLQCGPMWNYTDHLLYTLTTTSSGVRHMNEVNAHRARLVLGWLTIFGQVYHLGV